jgi:hypothetical protein
MRVSGPGEGRSSGAGLQLTAAIAVLASVPLSGCSGLGDAPGRNTMGFVLASYDYLFTPGPDVKAACPHGFAPSNREQWEAQFPTEAARQAHLTRCLATTHRGPNCENVWAAPDVIQDQLPYRPVEGKVAGGVDLDRGGGSAVCPHESFVSPQGKPGIDNQYYRFIGCDEFVQGGQHHAPANAKKRTAQYAINRILLEVTGVDDPKNDKKVEVTLYRGKDPLLVDGSDNAVPWQSQRVDETIPPIRLKGRIEGGVLVTEPQDVFWEGVLFERRQLLRGMSLALKLGGDRAEGLRTGYVDVGRLWQSYSRTAKWGGQIYGSSGPAAYRAMHALADGYKDPKTGQCTALSSARAYSFVRAHVIHSDSEASS